MSVNLLLNLNRPIDLLLNDQVYVQTKIDIVADFSSFHQAPLSIDKCVVLYCGRQCVPTPILSMKFLLKAWSVSLI